MMADLGPHSAHRRQTGWAQACPATASCSIPSRHVIRLGAGGMPNNAQEISSRLFAAADQLWTNTALRPDQYAQPVLALIALRQMEAKFTVVDAELRKTFKGRLKPTPTDYQARGAIFLPENARFSRLLALPGTADLGAELNAAMEAIAETNTDLAGALPRGYAGLPNSVLAELLRLLAP